MSQTVEAAPLQDDRVQEEILTGEALAFVAELHDRFGPTRARLLAARRTEPLVQLGHEGEGLGREDLLLHAVVLQGCGVDGLAHGRVPRIEWSSGVIGWKTGRSR